MDKQHFVGSDINKAIESLPVTVQSSINIQVDNRTIGNSQIKSRLQSTKQSETLPFTFNTCSNTQNITKDTTNELITAGSQIITRLQSTKQSATLPFTLCTTSNANQLKRDATKEFITANNIHLQSISNKSSVK